MESAQPTEPLLRKNTTPVPLNVWCAAGLAVLLRAIPFLITQVSTPAAGTAFVPIGYNPKDWLAYAGIIKNNLNSDGFFLANPFTTEPQAGSFILLYHSVLGYIHRISGIDIFWLLELSRAPLIFLLIFILWRFLEDVLPDVRTRSWACWLVALGGGLEFLILPFADFLSPDIAAVTRQELWHLQGWNTFESFYNPLWIAALCLTLWVLRPIFQSAPLRTVQQLSLALCFLVLFYTHPYSAIVAATVLVCHPLLCWLLRQPVNLERLWRMGLALAPVLAIIGAVSLWQRQDAVFKTCSGGVFGVQALPVFWYPVALGAVGALALRGLAAWTRDAHPDRFALGAWLIAIVFLHTSTVLNGYHFVFHLFIPVSVLAASGLADSVVAAGKLRHARAALWLAACFISPLYVTYQSVQDVNARSKTSLLYLNILEKLKALPAGNVLAPAQLGGLIPAYTPHRVYVGQWFLSPNYLERSKQYTTLVETVPNDAAALLRLIDSQQIAYVVVPGARVTAFCNTLGTRVLKVERVNQAAIVSLKLK